MIKHYSLSMASMFYPPAVWIPLHSEIRRAVKEIPVIACCRINDPLIAEKVLEEGHADAVNMVRAHIVDPDFPNKAREGRLDDIRACIACNQGCVDRNFDGKQITCIQNTTVGKEKEIGTIDRAAEKKKVLVIGAGPGGMEAARVAALRGHDVILMEKEAQMGGAINTLTKVPSREEFANVIRYLAKQIEKLGVDIRLGVEVTEDIVDKENPDAIIVATGAIPFIPDSPGFDQENVLTIEEVLNGDAPIGEQVAIIDTTALQEGPTVAELLADQGKKVKIITHFGAVGQFVGLTNLITMHERLLSRGVEFVTSQAVLAIQGESLNLIHVLTGETSVIDDVDTIVLASGYRAKNALYQTLQENRKEVYAIGDCMSPRRTLNAIHEGYHLARLL